VIVTGVPGPFVFVEVDGGGIFELLWQLFLGPHGSEEAGEALDQLWAASSRDLCRNGVSIRCFAAGETLDCFCDFSLCW